MACDPKTFNNVTAPVFNHLKKQLENLGYQLQGTSGVIEGPMGIVIQYEWDEKAATLFTQVKAKNFLVPCGRINTELAKAISSANDRLAGR